MSQYKSPNISKLKIDENMIWTISKCLAHQNWIKMGRELKIPDPELEQIQEIYKKDLCESAYRMLKFWHERTSTCIVQDLFAALQRLQWKKPIPEIKKHLHRYLIHLPTNSESNETNKWSNLNQRILRSIVLKMPIRFYLNCHMICNSWHNNGRDHYTDWVITNRANWSKSSFQNAMKKKVNCKEIYLRSTEEWKQKSAPTLIQEKYTGGGIQCISFSNDGTMLAVCHRYPHLLKIYNLMDISVRFSRDFDETLCSSHFNSSDSCILVKTYHSVKVIANAVGLPTLHSTSRSYSVRRPWLQDNIFITRRQDDKTYTKTFWLNKIPQKGDADTGMTKSLIHRVKDQTYKPGIIQTVGRNILLYKTDGTKLAFKKMPENIFGEFPTKQNDEKIETPDHEIDCKGRVWDYTLVPVKNTMEVYVFTDRKEDFCFMIIDLVNFELKTSILLVPHGFQITWTGVHLVSNSKCIISRNGYKHLCVWDLKSGACSNHLNEVYNDYYFCEIHPTDHELIITAAHGSRKFKLRSLNTPKYQPIA